MRFLGCISDTNKDTLYRNMDKTINALQEVLVVLSSRTCECDLTWQWGLCR